MDTRANKNKSWYLFSMYLPIITSGATGPGTGLSIATGAAPTAGGGGTFSGAAVANLGLFGLTSVYRTYLLPTGPGRNKKKVRLLSNNNKK